VKLTAKGVAALKLDGRKDAIFFDEDMPGFGYRLRLGSGDKTLRSYVVQYRRAGATRRILLGSAAVLSAEAARAAAKKILARVALGEDPAGDRHERRAKDKLSVRGVVDEYLAAKAPEIRAKTLREITRYLTGPYFRALHPIALDRVGRRDIASRVLAIQREHGAIVATRARAALSAFFTWAMRMGLCEHNAVVGTIEPKRSEPRSRVLSDDELVRIWRACGDDDYARIIKLAILLGQRRQEIGGMAWSEIDLKNGRWVLPPQRTKNGKRHELPLMPMALTIISAVPQLVSRDQLFGERSKLGFVAWDQHKRALDERSGVRGWTPHDLRRTFSTKLHDELSIAPHIVEALLNHYSGHRAGIASRYNFAKYQAQMRSALAQWEDHVRALVEGGERKVINLPH
jgi:integrase